MFEEPVAKAPLGTNGAEDPIVSIALEKPNSDLRRDVAKKLEQAHSTSHHRTDV
jgi:hypothetical protein